MDPQELRRLVGRWWWVVAALAVVGAAAAYGVSRALTPIYQAEGTLLVQAAPSQQQNSITVSPTQVTSTYAELVTARPILTKVISDLKLQETPEALAAKIKATPERDTEILKVGVNDADPRRAAEIDNTLLSDFVANVANQHQQQIAQAGNALVKQIQETKDDLAKLDEQLSAASRDNKDVTGIQDRTKADRDVLTQLESNYSQFTANQKQSLDNIALASPAAVPTAPASPRIMLNTVLGGFGGLLLGAGLVALLEYLDQTIRSEEDVRRRLGITTLGVIPTHASASGSGAAAKRHNEEAAEAFRRLRTNLRFCAVDKPLKSLVITSHRPGEGKTSVSANLARIVAAAGQRVVLVDADLRRPKQHEIFRKPMQNGLSEMLVSGPPSGAQSRNGAHHTDYRNLSLVTSGMIPPNAAELLASARTPQVIHLLEQWYDLVVVDTPPAEVVADAVGLAATVSATIVVVQAGSSARQAQATIEGLRHVGANVVGVVVNKAKRKALRYYYSYYGYYGAHGSTGDARQGPPSEEPWLPVIRPDGRDEVAAPPPPPPPPSSTSARRRG